MTARDVSSSPVPRLPRRQADSHKGTYGRCLLVGGSRGMCGAIAMTGRAALRSGAGLVTVATPNNCLDTVASFEPCYTTLGLSLGERTTPDLVDQIRSISCDVLSCGPGLGQAKEVTELVVALYRQVERPMVVDADGLNALAVSQHDLSQAAGHRVLTPHPGEFRRLWSAHSEQPCPGSADHDQLSEWAARHHVTLVLKGHATRVTDGRLLAVNSTGNPGMATGGAGDVLTGVITALLGQGLSPWDAARLGVYVHGLAGDLAAAELGETSMIASDIIHFLSGAFQHPDVRSEPASDESRST